jgi:hypothetical protein
LFEIQYKTSYSADNADYKTISIKPRLFSTINLPLLKILPATSIGNNDKSGRIVKMLKFMNVQDREFYKVLLKLTGNDNLNKKK